MNVSFRLPLHLRATVRWASFACGLMIGWLLCTSSCAAEDTSVALLVNGERLPARFVRISAGGEYVFDRLGKEQRVASGQLVKWGRWHTNKNEPLVVLDDGSVVQGDMLSLDAAELVVAGPLWPDLRIPRRHVRAVIWQLPSVTQWRDTLIDRACREERADHRLLLVNGDELRGRLAHAARPDAGAFRVTSIEWKTNDSGPASRLPLSQIRGVLFGGSWDPKTAKARQMMVGLRDGSRLAATRITESEQALQIELLCGVTVKTDPAPTSAGNPWTDVTMLQPLHEHVKYLSDRKPIGYQSIPFLTQTWPWRADRSVLGGWLRSGDSVFIKGIGMHSSARLVYELDGTEAEFHAELAIDAMAERRGSAVCRVFLQGTDGNWTDALTSPVIRGGQPPVPIRVRIDGHQRIALICDLADRGSQGDHVDWLDARLIPRAE